MSEYLRILTGPCEEEIQNPAIKLSFKGDDFQRHSFNCISKEENVLVTAHTGSGKTAVAKYAIAHFIKQGKKVVYTSPIKALSNQKYKEFKEDFEEKFSQEIGQPISVGLMTGDNKLNPDADLVIMTTEILRNALYDIGEKDKTQKEMYFEDDFISSIGCVIFDEVHYINDKDRGHVWEETIILLKPNITLVMLSATIDKPDDFASWIGNNKKKIVNLIPTTHRVVPLEHYFYVDKQLVKILDKNNNFLDDNFDNANKIYNNRYKDGLKVHLINEIVGYLRDRNLLQAIFFSFSRVNCEKYAKLVSVNLINHEERSEIEKIFNSFMHKYEKQYSHVPQYYTIKDLLLKGIAFHHSGLLPVLKEIIEIIFQKGLIKILFATETFAVGVNMPTRTIVFTQLEKFSNNGRRFLHTSEYKQMAGRAGRRGLDKFGNVIILPMYDMPYKQDVKNIMLGKVPHIESKFTINYSFILKIIQSNTKKMDQFINNSMFKKDNDIIIQTQKEKLIKLKENNNFEDFDNSNEQLESFKKFMYFQNLENRYSSLGISLSRKQQKDKTKLMKKLSRDKNFKEKYNKFKIYIDYKRELHDTQNYIDNVDNFVNNESLKLIKFLQNCGYIKNTDKNSHDLNSQDVTMKGIIAAQINECNPLILTEMIANKVFNGLTTEEIIGLLGIFIEDIKSNDRIEHSDVNCTKEVKNRITKVHKIIDNFINEEKKLGIDYHLYDYWNICYDYVDVGYQWARGCDINNIFKLINVYEGNFIRSMLKINSIANDLACLCHIYGDMTIIPQLEEIEEKIIRDIVNVSSLYLA